jgi:hypothetical protein
MAVCASCGRENRESRKFCVGCGRSLAVELTCPNCGAPYEPDESFCGDCGTALGATTPPPEPAEPTPVETGVAERRLVSVLFADLVGLTTLSEDGSPFLRELTRGRSTIAVSRLAAAVAGAPYIRHPSHGGAAAFEAGLRRAFATIGRRRAPVRRFL